MDREQAQRRSEGAREDAELVRRTNRGDRSAFDMLVIRHQGFVYNLCRRFLENREEAVDLSQEVFLRAYRSLGSFRGQSAFTTWLYRIAVNACKNRISSASYRAFRRQYSLDDPGGGTEKSAREVADSRSDPAAAIAHKEEHTQLMKCISRLPDEKRMLIMLRDIEGLSYEEISRILRQRLGTVKSSLARARSALRVIWEARCET